MATTAGAEEAAHPNANGNDAAREERVSPQVQSLRAMFPDFDVAVLQSVLDSVNGDQDRALDILLGMSDPDYVSTQPASQPEQPSVDLDEQLARQLMLEDQQQQQRHATGTSWPRRDQADVPYQARQAPAGQQRPPQESGRTDLQELQRTMGQIAESGKRTFSSIVSKVKAKINEYEASRCATMNIRPFVTSELIPTNTGQSPNSSTTPQWGSAPPTQLDRHTASQAYQQHYYGAETSPSPAVEQPIALNGPSAHGQVQGYDLDAPAAPAPAPTPAPAPAQRNLASPGTSPIPTPSAGAQISPAASPRPSGDVPRPPSTVSGSPVNAAKIGLLPKRPVSLLSANTPQATKPSDEDDELEYVENPFEEHK
ncbi:hypothetical protein C8Q79DRAFT_911399 [Trametes meyenii]|nr:hypothetical protein C8Q79DRAFT_911399 [Trametes meyenii]